MKRNYPVSSNELNDKLLGNYEHLVYLLGFDSETEPRHSGVYDHLESSGNASFISQSGVPSTNMSKMSDFLKFDYIYRKHFGQIKYKEQ